MGCASSRAAPAEQDNRVYCRRPGGPEIRPGVNDIQEWEFEPMRVTVPAGVGEGTAFPVRTLRGEDMEVVCPSGKVEGDSFQCLYYYSADELANSIGTDWHLRADVKRKKGQVAT